MLEEKIIKIAKDGKKASRLLGNLKTELKNKALINMAAALIANVDILIKANGQDLEEAKKNNLSPPLIDRLTLDTKRIEAMANGLREIASLPDPVGEVTKMWRRPNGLQIGKIRTPIGVIGVIYESRPNVTADAAALSLKSGNAIILRGGSEAIYSNIAIAEIISKAASEAGLPDKSIQLIGTTDREAIKIMLRQDKYIDMIIPRGGHSLIRMVTENSTIPVVKHDKGLCHVYIDKEANLETGKNIAINAKVQRPGVCNAMETLLVHRDVAEEFLPATIKELKEKGVEVRGCPKTREIVSNIIAANDEDWDTEYLDLILSIKVVDSFDEAVDHIAEHGSMHSEAIVTEDYSASWRFLREVDAAAVYVNASTRFTDGGEFGLGAEMGISTQKLHCRGPMGLEELTSTKYIIFGNGQIRE